MPTPAPTTVLTRPAEVPGVILAIDYGRKRLGLALSDESGVTTRPFATWTRTNRRRDLARLRELTRQHRVRRIVVGLPLHLDGATSEMAEEAQAFAGRVQKHLAIPVDMMDERLSSWEAHETVSASASKIRRRRGPSARASEKPSLDEIAAAIILRDYLDRRHSRPPAGQAGAESADCPPDRRV